jgi:DNA mismatch endonuclease (patch repair protein)
MMSGIRSKDTKPELSVRKALYQAGLRFRLHRTDLPGSPDIVLPKHKTVIFVHGCFWHGHGCHYCKTPKTRTEFWLDKLAGNAKRDRKNEDALRNSGWRVFVVWECDIRDKTGWIDTLIKELKKANRAHVPGKDQ